MSVCSNGLDHNIYFVMFLKCTIFNAKQKQVK
jgi:hypothetical protein